MLAKLLGSLEVTLIAPLVRGIRFAKRGAGPRIGQRKHLRLFRPQKQRPVRDRVEKGAVVAGYDDRHIARQRVQPILKLAYPCQVEMVGRLVEQQYIGLGHQRRGPAWQAAASRRSVVSVAAAAAPRAHRAIPGRRRPASFRLPAAQRKVSRARPHGRICPKEQGAHSARRNQRVSPRDRVISPSLASIVPAMQRSRVDFPRPLAATSPMRSPALTTRFN